MVKTRTSLESKHNPRNLSFSFHKQNMMIIGKINFPLDLKYFFNEKRSTDSSMRKNFMMV